MSQARPQAWWRQAHSDLDLAHIASGSGFHAQACFLASQAAEKALKGAIVELGQELMPCWPGWKATIARAE
jgi:HEPN domain-containing protein